MQDSRTPADVTTVYRFAAIPEWVLYHPDLSAICVRLYGALARHGTDQDRCYPSQARLAHLCGISERSVQAPLRQLERVGAIRRHLSDGRSTRYELAGDVPIGPGTEPASGNAPHDPDPALHSAYPASDSAGFDEEGALVNAHPALEDAYRPASHSADRPALYSAPKESQLNESQLNDFSPPQTTSSGSDPPTTDDDEQQSNGSRPAKLVRGEAACALIGLQAHEAAVARGVVKTPGPHLRACRRQAMDDYLADAQMLAYREPKLTPPEIADRLTAHTDEPGEVPAGALYRERQAIHEARQADAPAELDVDRGLAHVAEMKAARAALTSTEPGDAA